jgi:hypothetical protein
LTTNIRVPPLARGRGIGPGLVVKVARRTTLRRATVDDYGDAGSVEVAKEMKPSAPPPKHDATGIAVSPL